MLTWVNRIVREQMRELDLFGKYRTSWRLVRTSNAYVFRDPLPCSDHAGSSKSENPSGTLNPDISLLKKENDPKASAFAGMDTRPAEELTSPRNGDRSP